MGLQARLQIWRDGNRANTSSALHRLGDVEPGGFRPEAMFLDGTRPTETMTRQELAVVLDRLGCWTKVHSSTYNAKGGVAGRP